MASKLMLLSILLVTLTSSTSKSVENRVQGFPTGAKKGNLEVRQAAEETKNVHKRQGDCRTRMADLEARNAQLEKQYQVVLREFYQKEQDHTLEVSQLKDETNKLRVDMESMLVELQTLMDAKLSLELEIAAYRKLLETEESRMSSWTGEIIKRASVTGFKTMSDRENRKLAEVLESEDKKTGEDGRDSDFYYKSSIHPRSYRESAFFKGGLDGGASSQQRVEISSGHIPSYSIVSSGRVSDVKQTLYDTNDVNDKRKDSQLSMKMMRGEVSAKSPYQRTANGPVAIAETHPEGKFVVLENNPSSGVRKNVDLTSWTLQQQGVNKMKIVYKFPPNTVLRTGKTLKIWARSFSSERGARDLVFNDEDTWGTGSYVITTLFNGKNEEMASHIKKTLQV